MLSGKKVFISGGAGFIGRSVAERPADEKRVVLYDNLHRNALRRTSLLNHANIDFQEGDVLDAATVTKAMEGSNCVVHCAAIAGVDTVIESPVRTMRVNLLGTVNVLEAAHRLPRLERFIDFSTSEVFGTH